MRRNFLLRVAGVVGKRSFQHIVRFVLRILPFAAVNRPFEIEPNPMYGLSGKAKLATLQLAAAKKLIEKCSIITFSSSIARDESCYPAFVFDGNLYELSVF